MATGTFLRRTRLNSVRMRAPRMFRGAEASVVVFIFSPVVESWEVRSHGEAVFNANSDGDGTFDISSAGYGTFDINSDGGGTFNINSDGFTVWSVK